MLFTHVSFLNINIRSEQNPSNRFKERDLHPSIAALQYQNDKRRSATAKLLLQDAFYLQQRMMPVITLQ